VAIRLDDPRPPFQQLADELRDAIAAGKLRPGERLPSNRELAEREGIAAMTVQRAVSVLREEGLVFSAPGRGVFVRGTGDEVMTNGATATDELRALEARVARLESIVSQAGLEGAGGHAKKTTAKSGRRRQ
jgi:DNA-binding GntR family transcriptional regulator